MASLSSAEIMTNAKMGPAGLLCSDCYFFAINRMERSLSHWVLSYVAQKLVQKSLDFLQPRDIWDRLKCEGRLLLLTE